MIPIKKTIYVVIGLIILALGSCTKDYEDYGPKLVDDNIEIPVESSVIVLNEGNFMFGNGSISLLDENTETVGNEVFKSVNGFPLGDVPQSMIIHDTLGYIVVNNSSKIEVVDGQFKSKRTITGFNSPRHMAIIKEQPLTAWVTDLYADKIWEVNLDSGMINGSVNAPGWSENIYIWKSLAFVLNKTDSVLNMYNTDNGTLMQSYSFGGKVIDFRPWSFSELVVLTNKGIISMDLLLGGFTSLKNFDDPINAIRMDVDTVNNLIYYLDQGLYRYDLNEINQVVNPKPGSNYYGLSVKQSTGEVYVTDVKDYVQPGELKRYTLDFQDSLLFDVGINPQFILFQ